MNRKSLENTLLYTGLSSATSSFGRTLSTNMPALNPGCSVLLDFFQLSCFWLCLAWLSDHQCVFSGAVTLPSLGVWIPPPAQLWFVPSVWFSNLGTWIWNSFFYIRPLRVRKRQSCECVLAMLFPHPLLVLPGKEGRTYSWRDHGCGGAGSQPLRGKKTTCSNCFQQGPSSSLVPQLRPYHSHSHSHVPPRIPLLTDRSK
jgi:hypothetical protein